jgi:hypothetical protein
MFSYECTITSKYEFMFALKFYLLLLRVHGMSSIVKVVTEISRSGPTWYRKGSFQFLLKDLLKYMYHHHTETFKTNKLQHGL